MFVEQHLEIHDDHTEEEQDEENKYDVMLLQNKTKIL